MIHFQSVTKCYGRSYALRNLSFHIPAGEMVFLTGHSGAGKSTVLKLISALESATQGHVLINGRSLERVSRDQALRLRRSMGIILQTPQLLLDRTIFANVALPLVIQGYSSRESARRVQLALDTVGLSHKQQAYPAELSSGEQQRVAIARATVHQPALILADEPTGNLDTLLAYDIMQLFARMNQRGATVLIASHDLALIARLKYRALTLAQGACVETSDLIQNGSEAVSD